MINQLYWIGLFFKFIGSGSGSETYDLPGPGLGPGPGLSINRVRVRVRVRKNYSGGSGFGSGSRNIRTRRALVHNQNMVSSPMSHYCVKNCDPDRASTVVYGLRKARPGEKIWAIMDRRSSCFHVCNK